MRRKPCKPSKPAEHRESYPDINAGACLPLAKADQGQEVGAFLGRQTR